ncbi:DUF6538 domain-containing protein [Pseudomonas monteilii]
MYTGNRIKGSNPFFTATFAKPLIIKFIRGFLLLALREPPRFAYTGSIHRVALAIVRPTKDARGVYEYKRHYPSDLAQVFGKNARWKRSLGTRDLSEARMRYAEVHLECEREFAMLRATHVDGDKLSMADAQQLASRWLQAKLDKLEKTEAYSDFLVQGGYGWESFGTFFEDGNSAGVSVFIRDALSTHHYLQVAEGSEAYCKLVDAFWVVVQQLSSLCYARYVSRGIYTPRPAVMPRAPLAIEVQVEQALSGPSPTLQYVFDKWAEDKLHNDSDAERTVEEYLATIRRFQELHGDMPVKDITRAVIGDFRISLGKIPVKGEGLRGLSAPEAIARGQAEGLSTASLLTIKKQLRFMGAVLSFAVQRLEVMPEEPVKASGILKNITKAAQRAETRTGEDKTFARAELR